MTEEQAQLQDAAARLAAAYLACDELRLLVRRPGCAAFIAAADALVAACEAVQHRAERDERQRLGWGDEG